MVAVAQLAERQVVVLDVAGSNPVGHPNYSSLVAKKQHAPLAQWQSNGLLIHRFWVRIPGGAQTFHSAVAGIVKSTMRIDGSLMYNSIFVRCTIGDGRSGIRTASKFEGLAPTRSERRNNCRH